MENYKNLDLNDLDGEIWKTIVEYPDYQISNFSRVKSFKCHKEMILKINIDTNGYFYTTLYKFKNKKHKRIHILMYETFNNYKLKNNECIHHIDFTKNNYLENFELMNKFEHHKLHSNNDNHPRGFLGKKHSDNDKIKMSVNVKKAFESGKLNQKGEKNNNSIFNEKQIIQIHILKKLGFKNIEISKIYNTDRSQISQILLGKSWNHIYKQFYERRCE